MRAILTAIHNRVYQTGFEDKTVFPVSITDLSHTLSFENTNLPKLLLFSAYPDHEMRITEAVFEKSCEKLTLRITPIYNFFKAERSLWDTFLRMYVASPRVSSSRAESV
jgi:hypothetical protein